MGAGRAAPRPGRRRAAQPRHGARFGSRGAVQLSGVGAVAQRVPPLLLAAIAEELASHGYVVVGVNHTYESAVTVLADVWRITCDLLLAFFAKHLEQAAAPPLGGPSGDYPELAFGSP